MVTDPYKVLGISRDASKEDIKKAYRRMAKKYHPDLHPDDPDATAKMNEINEAYDMLMHPEKYANRAGASNQGGYGGYRSGTGYGNGSGYGDSYGNGNGYGNGSGYDGGSGDPYGRYQRQQGGGQGGSYQNGGGYGSQGPWTYYDFNDLFGFGRRNQTVFRPSVQPGDSAYVRQAIAYMNQGRYMDADTVLNSILSKYRDARWYYLSAVANFQMNRTVSALEKINTAVRLDPGNPIYQGTLQEMQGAGSRYSQQERDFSDISMQVNRACITCCALQLFCSMFRCY